MGGVVLCLAFTLTALMGPAAAQGTTGNAKAAELNTKGAQAYKAKDWETAIDSFTRALELAPENTVIRKNLCNAYHAAAIEFDKADRIADAISLLLSAVSVDPKNASPYIQLGACYLRLDHTRDAIASLETAIQLDPKNVDAHFLLGQAYYDDNDLSAALTQWEYVREVNPGRVGLKERMEAAYRHQALEQNNRQSSTEHFDVSYDPGTTGGDLGLVRSTCERAYREIGRRLGGVYPPTPIKVVLYTQNDFSKATLKGEHVGAVYDGKIRMPIKDKSGHTLPPDELERRIFHEYTHVVVKYWTGGNVPWWFNEGLAETFSKPALSDGDKALLADALAKGKLFDLRTIEDNQLTGVNGDNEEALWLAYVQSHAVVRFLWTRYGVRHMTTFMNALAQKAPAEQALGAGYRLDYNLLQKNFVNRIKR